MARENMVSRSVATAAVAMAVSRPPVAVVAATSTATARVGARAVVTTATARAARTARATGRSSSLLERLGQGASGATRSTWGTATRSSTTSGTARITGATGATVLLAQGGRRGGIGDIFLLLDLNELVVVVEVLVDDLDLRGSLLRVENVAGTSGARGSRGDEVGIVRVRDRLGVLLTLGALKLVAWQLFLLQLFVHYNLNINKGLERELLSEFVEILVILVEVEDVQHSLRDGPTVRVVRGRIQAPELLDVPAEKQSGQLTERQGHRVGRLLDGGIGSIHV